MGRRVVWSDDEIQKIAARFVCALDEAWALNPPDWVDRPANPESTRLFRAFIDDSDGLLRRDARTVQGLYCMTPDGEFLGGHHGRASAEVARDLLQRAWTDWSRRLARSGRRPQPIPQDPIPLALGDELPAGGLKLAVAVRDLPRGEDRRPGQLEWQRAAYNLSWLDLSPAEVRRLIPKGDEELTMPRRLFARLATTCLKDSVRGQCSDWSAEALRSGGIVIRREDVDADTTTLRLSGEAALEQDGRRYDCQLFGRAEWDASAQRILHFELLAVGQRRGADRFNAREADLGPAPMGVAFVMHQTPGTKE